MGGRVMASKRQRVDLAGADDLLGALKRMTEDVGGEHLRAATEAGAELVVNVARQLAPRSDDGSHGNPPGYMAAGIHSERQWTSRQDKAETRVGWSKDGWYGQLQETGTVHQPAQAHMRPALDETKGDVIDEIADTLRDRIFRGLR